MTRPGGRSGSAGWSAAAKAAAVREEARGGIVRRALASVGLDPLAGRVRAAEVTAGRWEAGARGEALTAALLQPLADKGWGGFYDRALPGNSRANLDHVLLPPGAGLLVVVDSKLWSARRGPVHRARDGRLMHGVEDRESAARALRFEAQALAGALGGAGVLVPVVPVIAVHGARVTGGRFMLDGGGDRGVTVIEASGLVGLLRSWAGEPDPRGFVALAAIADRVLPRYVEGGGRR